MIVIQRRPIESLQPHPENPRLGDVDAIKESIRVNGWHGAITIQKSTGYILVGNHRRGAAWELYQGNMDPLPGQSAEELEKEKARWRAELAKLPTHVADVDDDVARRILLADNRTADLATYDDSKLLRLTAQILDPETAIAVLHDERSSPEDVTEALRLLAADKAKGGKLAGTGYKSEDVEQLALAMAPAEGAEWGSEGEGRVKIYDRWEESQLRQLILPMLVAEYDQVIQVLTAVQEKQGLLTNTDAFFWVLAKALPRQFSAPEPMRDEAEGAAPERQAAADA